MSFATQSHPGFVTGNQDEPPAGPGSRRVSATDGYQRWASTYDEFPNPLLAREERHLLPLVTDLHDKCVLDLACGTGRWLEQIMGQRCKSGIGVDCSSAMLHVAGKKKAIRGRLVRANCENLPLPSAAFDLVICSFALGHVQNMGSMVRELVRVTKARADIFVSDLHPEAYDKGWRVGFRENGTAIEIDTRPRATEEIVHAFCERGFQSQGHETLWLGEQEKPLFIRAGKSHAFVEACRLPAVLICHFRRIES